ncbi:MAG: hypothetical protein U0800_07815 [Isosphaeraceae bacterium]
MRIAIPFAGLSLAVALLAAGCGGESRPTLVSVSGKVTLDGQPAEGVDLSFLPDSTNKHPTPGRAKTDAQGAYQAKVEDGNGLSPGKYRVLAVKRVPSAKGIDPAIAELGGQMKDLLPTRYGSVSDTDLKVEVPDAGTSSADLSLSSKGGGKK